MPASINAQFVVYNPEQQARIEPADATLYQRLEQNYNGFQGHTLVSCYEFDADWANWELHPAGDEVVILLSGQATMLLQHEHGIVWSICISSILEEQTILPSLLY